MFIVTLANGFKYQSFDDEDTKEVWSRPAYIRYHRGSGLFDLYCYSMTHCQAHTWKRVSGSDLLTERKNPAVDTKWTDIEGDLYTDLIALRQRFFVSESKLLEAMKQEHRYRLGRCESTWIELKKKDYASAVAKRDAAKGADPQNIENADVILRKSVERGDIDTFFMMCKDLGLGKKSAMEKWKEMREKC